MAEWKIDRINIDILDWIRRMFYRFSQSAPTKQSFKPEVLKTRIKVNGKPFDGRLILVRRDTRRAIHTWVYMPPRKGVAHARQKDVHICLDTLEKLPNERGEPFAHQIAIQRSKGNTHRITILKTSHWCDKDGAYKADEVFSGYFRFGGRSDPHQWAIAAVDDLAALVPFRWDKGDINWDLEIGLSRIQHWQEKRD